MGSKTAAVTVAAVTPRLLTKYRNEVVPVLHQEFGYKSIMQVPKLEKIVVNMGVKEGQEDIKIIEQLSVELSRITGQKPIMIRARKAISGFKLRQNSPIGLKVTLRGLIMYEFFDRLISIAMPRIRDFQGYSDRSFDGQGNFTIGLKEQTIFPEVEFDKVKMVKGMDITFVTTAENNKEGRRLLECMGLPFRKPSVQKGN